MSQTNVESIEVISPKMTCWTFELNLSGMISRSANSQPPMKASQNLVSTLQLPEGHHIQVLLRSEDHQPSRHHAHQRVHYYHLVLDKLVGYLVKISARRNVTSIHSCFGQLSTNLVNGELIDIQPGVPLPIASLSEQAQLGYQDPPADLEIVLNVHFPVPIGENVQTLSSGEVALMQNHVELLGSLLSLGQFADCKVFSNDGKFHECHKALLCLKSEVFQKAFETENMVEAQTNEIIIDCDSHIADLILPYFYTGRMPKVTVEFAMELYRVAHMYNIEGLRAFVAEQIMLKASLLVSISTVLEMTVFAENFDLKSFQQFCLKFMNVNRSAVLNLPEWKAFRVAHLNLVDQLLLI